MASLTIVLPAFNEEDSIQYAADELEKVLRPAQIPYEILYVDDGSKDQTYERIAALSKEHDNIKGIRFSRNFGKEAALFAGLSHAGGDCVAVMDCDMQHPPETLVEMYRLWQQGYQVVEGVKSDRGEESKTHGFASNLFYSMISRLSGMDMKDSSDFKLLDREVVQTLCRFPERQTFFRGLSFWVGYRTASVSYAVRPRAYGETKWSFFKLLKYAVNNITCFSSAPLRMIFTLGALFFLVSFIALLFSSVELARTSYIGIVPFLVFLAFFVGGAILCALGVVGYYLAKIYDEVKGRPRYIVQENTWSESTVVQAGE